MFILIWVIIMRKKTKIFLISFTVSLLSLLIFVSSGFFYLQSTETKVENKSEKVPFYQVPESKGIIFQTPQSKTFLYMDYTDKVLSVIYLGDEEYESEIYGYKIDYTIKSNYTVLEEIIDNLGGIDLETEEEIYNYTGTQVVDLICKTVDIEPLKKTVTQKIIEKIGEKGMTLEELIYIIENSETDLTVPDCYSWPENIGKICKNARFINP